MKNLGYTLHRKLSQLTLSFSERSERLLSFIGVLVETDPATQT